MLQDVREALGNVAEIGKLSSDIVRDGDGPTTSSVATAPEQANIRPLDSATDFTDFDEDLEEETATFKVHILQCFSFIKIRGLGFKYTCHVRYKEL